MDFLNNAQFQSIMKVVGKFVTILVIVAIVAVIIFCILDLLKAVTSSDEDRNKQAFSKIKSRLISLVIFLLVPTIVALTMHLIGSGEFVFFKKDFNENETGNGNNHDNNEGTGTPNKEGTSYGKYDILDGYIDFDNYVKVR